MTSNKSIPYLSGEDLAALKLTTAEVIDSIENLVRGQAEQTV